MPATMSSTKTRAHKNCSIFILIFVIGTCRIVAHTYSWSIFFMKQNKFTIIVFDNGCVKLWIVLFLLNIFDIIDKNNCQPYNNGSNNTQKRDYFQFYIHPDCLHCNTDSSSVRFEYVLGYRVRVPYQKVLLIGLYKHN